MRGPSRTPTTTTSTTITTAATEHLFLLSILGLSLGLGSLLARTSESGIGPGNSQSLVSILLALWQIALLDLADAVLDADARVDRQRGADLGHRVVLADALDLVGAAVEFLVLAALAWEQDQACLVCLQSLDVQGKAFLRCRLAARVDGDADCGCEFAWDAGFLFAFKILHVSLSRSCDRV